MKPSLSALSMKVLYPLYVNKIERKGRQESELLDILSWFTGYERQTIKDMDVTLEVFFRNASHMTSDIHLIKGKICGVDIESIEDPTYKRIRQMDKIVDELAKGKSVEKITTQRKT